MNKYLFFLIRQIYKVFLVWPFQFVVLVMSWFNPAEPLKNKAPESFCFVITSVIYPKQGKIQYNDPRSVFTPEERAQQTVHTVESIRAKIPGVKVVLVESGLKKDLPFDLDKKADKYIYLGDKKLVRWACDSKYKSLGETVMLLSAAKQFNHLADFYFKISGRYYLDDDFNINNWKDGLFVVQYMQEDYICTRLYGWRAEAFNTWKYALLKGLPLAIISYAVENTLAKYIPRKQARNLPTLGVMGVGGSDKVVVKD